jgi:phage shock protein C
MNRRLYRSRRDSVLGGVAGGVAEYLDVDPSIVRVIWAILAIVTGGIFLLLYIVMWIVVPESPTAGYAPPPSAAQPPPGTAPPPGAAQESSPGAAAEPAAPAPAWGSEQPRHRPGGSNGALILGLILVGAGIWFLIDEYLPAIEGRFVWPVALVVIGLVLLVVAVRRPRAE